MSDFWVVDIVNRHGVHLARVDAKSGSWATRVNGYGQGRHTFLPGDLSQGYTAEEWRDLTRPGGDRVVVVSRLKNDGDSRFAVYAGLIDDRVWDDDTGELTVSHRELRWILADRFGAIVPLYNPSSSFGVSNKSLRGAARAIIAKGLISTPGNNWHFPVVLPADEAGGFSKEWPLDKFSSIEDMLAEVSAMDGGPDIAFDAVWTADGRLEWWARIGSPRIAGSTFEWATGVADSPVRGFREQENSAEQKSGVFAPGDGSGPDRPVGRAGNVAGSGMPDRDAVEPFSQVERLSDLNSLALENLKVFREPARSTTFGLYAPDTDLGDTFRLGARTRVWVQGNAFLVDGWREGYVTQLSGDMGSMLRVEVQP